MDVKSHEQVWKEIFGTIKEEEFSTEEELREAVQSQRDGAGFEISEEDEEGLVRWWEYYTTA